MCCMTSELQQAARQVWLSRVWRNSCEQGKQGGGGGRHQRWAVPPSMPSMHAVLRGTQASTASASTLPVYVFIALVDRSKATRLLGELPHDVSAAAGGADDAGLRTPLHSLVDGMQSLTTTTFSLCLGALPEDGLHVHPHVLHHKPLLHNVADGGQLGGPGLDVCSEFPRLDGLAPFPKPDVL